MWVLSLTLVLMACGARHKRSDPAGDELVGRWYTVVSGDTVAGLSKRFNVPLDDLVELNALVDPDRLEVGQKLFLYGVEEVVRRLPKAKPPKPPQGAESGEHGPEGVIVWPLEVGVVSSGYGARWGRNHKGIDIAAAEGTPVLSAAAGEVVYAERSSGGYGNLVIIKHDGGWITVYGHNSRILVDEGDRVGQGAAIAEVGSTGRSTGPHLHFEIRIEGEAVDPLIHLPAR